MRVNFTKWKMNAAYGGRLSVLALMFFLFCLSGCGNETPVEEAPVSAATVSEPVDDVSELPAEEAEQSSLREKLEMEHQELIDMNQRKADLEAEILQIKQAISEADRAIEQKEQELEAISTATDA